MEHDIHVARVVTSVCIPIRCTSVCIFFCIGIDTNFCISFFFFIFAIFNWHVRCPYASQCAFCSFVFKLHAFNPDEICNVVACDLHIRQIMGHRIFTNVIISIFFPIIGCGETIHNLLQ